MLGEPIRKFTIMDAMVLVTAVGIGLALVRAYQSTIESAEAADFQRTFPISIRWFGRPAPLFASLTLALFALRLIGPRPRYRRLVGSPGFATCYGAALGLAITALTFVMDLVRFYLGFPRSQIYFCLLMMRSITFAAPSVASVWVALGLLGCWRRHRVWDWVEVCGECHRGRLARSPRGP
jgi:hypothetical protein